MQIEREKLTKWKVQNISQCWHKNAFPSPVPFFKKVFLLAYFEKGFLLAYFEKGGWNTHPWFMQIHHTPHLKQKYSGRVYLKARKQNLWVWQSCLLVIICDHLWSSLICDNLHLRIVVPLVQTWGGGGQGKSAWLLYCLLVFLRMMIFTIRAKKFRTRKNFPDSNASLL